MKKLTALLLSVVLVLSLAACGSACIFHHAARNLCADRTARHGTV